MKAPAIQGFVNDSDSLRGNAWRSIVQFMTRHKLYHIPLWFLYHCSWWTLKTGDPSVVVNNIIASPYSIKFFFYVVFQALAVYFNLYFLIPRYLEKGRYLHYTCLLLLTILVAAAFIVTGYYAGALLSEKTFSELYNRSSQEFYYFFENNALPSTMASMTLAMSIKLTKQWLRSRQREQRLEFEKLQTELKFLRAQFNPHFLFNTINSIFVLINKNPKVASESLAKFSELLRYQLYECNEQQIPVSQELLYLSNFIELEKLRQDTNIRVSVNIAYPKDNDLKIAPFIIMPFVENAFKHVSQFKDRSNEIDIAIRFERNELIMHVVNSSFQQVFTQDVMRYGGVGLKNVQRRLHLLYPDSHSLHIKNEKNKFEVSLNMKLDSKHEMNHMLTMNDAIAV